ncbi:hypothetical protein AAG906_022631 [Vitis piasezkii]
MFKEFHEQNSFLKSLNNTFLVLLPKEEGSLEGYKLLAKVLANRLKKVIGKVAKKEHLMHLSWIFFWFEAASGLRINLAKSEIIPVGEVEEVDKMAVELECRVGLLPSVYLGVPNKASSVWDGVEERVRRRLALWKLTRRLEKLQRDFLWGGGNLERKAHLVNWEVVASPLNKALLGKWIWRFACVKDDLWAGAWGYGQEDFGWRTKKTNGAFGVGLWKEILKESDWCWENMVFNVGKGTKIRFWTDLWCVCTVLSQRFPHLYAMAVHRNATVEEMWDQNFGHGGWNLRISLEEDSVYWKEEETAVRVKKAYNLLVNPIVSVFRNCIWVDRVPTKITFFAWEATWGRCKNPVFFSHSLIYLSTMYNLPADFCILFSTSNKGVEGMTVQAERLNFLRFLSHFRAVHRGASFAGLSTTSVRKLLPEAWGFLCPVHTPDGEPCGLLNHMASTCRKCTSFWLSYLYSVDFWSGKAER